MGNTLGTATLTVPMAVIIDEYVWTVGDASLDGYVVAVSGTSLEGTMGDATLDALKATVSATAPDTIGYASLEVPLAAVTGEQGGLATINAPMASVSGMGYQSTLGTAVLEMPIASVTGEQGGLASITVSLAAISGMGLVGTLGTATVNVPVVEVSALGSVQTIGTASLSVPLAHVSGSGSYNTTGAATISIPMVQVSGSSYVGTLGTASLTVPLADVTGGGFFNTIGTASITVPLAQVTGYAPEVVVLVDINGDNESLTGYALVLNLRNHALTEYDNYGFNSFCHFNGRYLGASSTGIFNLTGRDDNGTKIRAKARTGLQDGGTALRKGIEDVFLGISADDAMTARVVTDGYETFDGSTINPRKDEVVTERVKFGKGIRSRYLGIEIENRAGCDFTLESAELVIVPLTRKL